MIKKTFSDKALLESIEEAMMQQTPDVEDTKTEEEETDIESEPTGDELIDEIETETDNSEEEPEEESSEVGGDMEELPPMLGSMPEE